MEVLSNIFGLFYIANPECSYDEDRANEFIKTEIYTRKKFHILLTNMQIQKMPI